MSVAMETRLRAQETPPSAAAPQTDLLKKFEGEWTASSRSVGVDGKPAGDIPGTLRARMLGNSWVINEWTGDMPGMTMEGLQTIGYDTNKKKYVGTWVDNFSDYMWSYEGTFDEATKRLTLEAKGPSMSGDGSMSLYRDSYRFESESMIEVKSEVQDADGKWITFMTGQLKRNAK
jgi:hypothetical protein